MLKYHYWPNSYSAMYVCVADLISELFFYSWLVVVSVSGLLPAGGHGSVVSGAAGAHVHHWPGGEDLVVDTRRELFLMEGGANWSPAGRPHTL